MRALERIEEIGNRPLRYMWREIWKMSWKDFFRYFTTIICFCAIWWGLETHIDKQLVTWTIKWIEPLDPTIAITALYSLLGIGIAYAFYAHVKKNAHLLYGGWVFWTQLTIVYSYYRFNPTSPFLFWKTGNWVWLDILYVIDGLYMIFSVSYGIRVLISEFKDNNKHGELLRDDAIDDFLDDKFGYFEIARYLKWRMDAVDLSEKAYSVGITGNWGTGKSSLLNLFAKQQIDDKQIVVRFNPRSAKKADLIQEEFFTAFTHELNKYSFNAHHIVGKYAYALNLHSSTKWIYAFIDLFENLTAASEKARINDLIRASGKRVYVIIEDLDRLTGQEILEVLKLIDANGNFCHTVFLTAYDKEYVNGVLQKQIGYDAVSAKFTDKYFQYDYPLNRQTQQPLESFVDLYMRLWALEIWGSNKYQKQLIDTEWTIVKGLVLSHITNMREAKRYINLFRSTYRWNKDRVDFGDCAIVTLIRFLNDKVYHELYKKSYLHHPGEAYDDKDMWALTEDYDNALEYDMRGLVEYLFNGPSGTRQFEPKYNKICRVESFDNYFHDKTHGKIYGDQLDLMMEVEQLSDAIERFDYYAKNDAGKKSITEYLCMHDEGWVGDTVRLERYIEILLYALDKISEKDIEDQLTLMLTKAEQDKYNRFIKRDAYLASIKKAIDFMLLKTPVKIGIFFKGRLNTRYANRDRMVKTLAEPLEFDHYVVLEALKEYDEKSRELEWDAKKSIRLATTVKGEDVQQAKARAEHLMKMMNDEPDEYAKGLISIEVSAENHEHTCVKLVPYDGMQLTIGDAAMMEWAKKIKDADMQYIVTYLLTHRNSKGWPSAQLELPIVELNGEYGKIAEMLKAGEGKKHIYVEMD